MHGRLNQKQMRALNESKIMRAAEKVFAEAGYKGASISMIAAEAGVPKSNIVYYFETKEKLYSRVIDDIYNLWLQASDRMDETDNPADALKCYIHDKMDLARERPNGSKVWANEIIHGAPYIRQYIDGSLKTWMESRTEILKRWMREGYIKEMSPETILYMIWATTQHYADFSCQIEALNGDKAFTEQQWTEAKNTVTKIILGGIGFKDI